MVGSSCARDCKILRRLHFYSDSHSSKSFHHLLLASSHASTRSSTQLAHHLSPIALTRSIIASTSRSGSATSSTTYCAKAAHHVARRSSCATNRVHVLHARSPALSFPGPAPPAASLGGLGGVRTCLRHAAWRRARARVGCTHRSHAGRSASHRQDRAPGSDRHRLPERDDQQPARGAAERRARVPRPHQRRGEQGLRDGDHQREGGGTEGRHAALQRRRTILGRSKIGVGVLWMLEQHPRQPVSKARIHVRELLARVVIHADPLRGRFYSKDFAERFWFASWRCR